jgi:hypothetical protein
LVRQYLLINSASSVVADQADAAQTSNGAEFVVGGPSGLYWSAAAGFAGLMIGAGQIMG